MFEIAIELDNFILNPNWVDSIKSKRMKKLYSWSLYKKWLRMGKIHMGRWLPGSVLSLNLCIGKTCAVLGNLGNTLWVIDLLFISETKWYIRDWLFH